MLHHFLYIKCIVTCAFLQVFQFLHFYRFRYKQRIMGTVNKITISTISSILSFESVVYFRLLYHKLPENDAVYILCLYLMFISYVYIYN